MMLNLDEITAACEAATPGPWICECNDVTGRVKYFVSAKDGLIIGIDGGIKENNADFVAQSRQWVPELVAEVRRLRAERDAAKRDIEDAMTCMDIPMACNWCKHKNNCKAACGPEWVGLEVQNGQD